MIFVCALKFSTASFKMLLSAFIVSHSTQKFLVWLIGFSLGGIIDILLGKSIESPIIIASPTSSKGNCSVTVLRPSGSKFFIVFLSRSFVRRKTIKLLH